MTLARLLPVTSFALLSYAAGLTAMSARAYLLATGIGMLPMTFVYVAFGHTITLSPLWMALFSAALVTLLFVLPRWIERRNVFGLKKYFPHLVSGGRRQDI